MPNLESHKLLYFYVHKFGPKFHIYISFAPKFANSRNKIPSFVEMCIIHSFANFISEIATQNEIGDITYLHVLHRFFFV